MLSISGPILEPFLESLGKQQSIFESSCLMPVKCHPGSTSECVAEINCIFPSSSGKELYPHWAQCCLGIIENVTCIYPPYFCFHMLKLMCHCEDSKQMGKGQGFFVAKCVSMVTAICVHYQKASFVWLYWLIRGGRSPPLMVLGGLFLFCSSSCSENHSDRSKHK